MRSSKTNAARFSLPDKIWNGNQPIPRESTKYQSLESNLHLAVAATSVNEAPVLPLTPLYRDIPEYPVHPQVYLDGSSALAEHYGLEVSDAAPQTTPKNSRRLSYCRPQSWDAGGQHTMPLDHASTVPLSEVSSEPNHREPIAQGPLSLKYQQEKIPSLRCLNSLRPKQPFSLGHSLTRRPRSTSSASMMYARDSREYGAADEALKLAASMNNQEIENVAQERHPDGDYRNSLTDSKFSKRGCPIPLYSGTYSPSSKHTKQTLKAHREIFGDSVNAPPVYVYTQREAFPEFNRAEDVTLDKTTISMVSSYSAHGFVHDPAELVGKQPEKFPSSSLQEDFAAADDDREQAVKKRRRPSLPSNLQRPHSRFADQSSQSNFHPETRKKRKSGEALEALEIPAALISPTRSTSSGGSLPPRSILKTSISPSQSSEVQRERKRLKLSLPSPPLSPIFHDLSSPGASSPRAVLARVDENNLMESEPSTEHHEMLGTSPQLGGSLMSRSRTASYTPSTHSRRSTLQTPARRPSTSSRLTSGGSSIPMRAFISPLRPSLRGPDTGSHLNDPTMLTRYSGDETSSRKSHARRMWMKLSPHAWLFLLGFMFFPAWWAGSILRPRHVVYSRMRRNGLVEEWNELDEQAVVWRFRCRLITGFSFVVYVPVIVLAIVFST